MRAYRPMHQLSSCLLLLVTAHVKVCHLAYDISKPYGQDRPVVPTECDILIICRVVDNITTKSGSLRNSVQNVGKYCGAIRYSCPPWFQHCWGERPRRSSCSDASVSYGCSVVDKNTIILTQRACSQSHGPSALQASFVFGFKHKLKSQYPVRWISVRRHRSVFLSYYRC